jgi:glutathionylspermidine synthase
MNKFVDNNEEAIECMFKLYPWEWLMSDEFGGFIGQSYITMFEPAWKMLLSNKGLLPVLWELYPGHKNLLPSYFEEARISGDYVRKPLLSREGANIEMLSKGQKIVTEGTYGNEGFIYQTVCELPRFNDRYAVVGSWIVNEFAAGIGIREDDSPITKNTSSFVPHYFV